MIVNDIYLYPTEVPKLEKTPCSAGHETKEVIFGLKKENQFIR